MLTMINRYRLKEGITMRDILAELKRKGISCNNGGLWVQNNAKYICFKPLIDEVEVNIAFPEDLSEWNDFDYVLVMDDSFGQPYTPFYSDKLFPYVLNVIGHYNKFMNGLSFLEKVSKDG